MEWSDEPNEIEIKHRDSPGCCYEPISKDLQARLNSAVAQLTKEQEKSENLKKQLLEKERENERLKFKLENMQSEHTNVEDQSSILITKTEYLRSELKKQKATNSDMKKDILAYQKRLEEITKIVEKKESKIMRCKAELGRLNRIREENESLQAENKTLNQQLVNQSEAFNEQHAKITEDCLLKCKKAENKSHSLRKKLKEAGHFHSQNQQLILQVEDLSKIVKENKQFINEITNKNTEYQNKIELLSNDKNQLLSSVEEMKKNAEVMQKSLIDANEINKNLKTQVEISEKQMNLMNNKIVELQKSVAENAVLRTKMEAMGSDHSRITTLEAGIKELEQENESLHEQLSTFEVELNIEKKTSEAKAQAIQDLQKKLLEAQNMRISVVTNEQQYNVTQEALDKARNEIRLLQNEISERETREQNLSTKYRFFKLKSKQLEAQVNQLETNANNMFHEVFKLREKESRKEAALRRKDRHQINNDNERYRNYKELEKAKITSFKTQSRYDELNRKVRLAETP